VKPDEVISTENIPTAGVRFINAVPDTSGAFGLDFRFIDLAESNAQFRIQFRNNPATSGTGASAVTASTQIQFKPARAGNRQFRIFLSDSLQSVASVVLKDSTLNLEAGKNYTLMLWGNARSTGADKMKLSVWEENVDPATNVGLRVINATTSPIDARQYVSSGTPPATATWANVPPLSVSAYVNQPPSQFRFNIQPAGGGTALFSDALALIGAAATVDVEALPGTTIAGSAVTAIVFPRSVAGSKAPQGIQRSRCQPCRSCGTAARQDRARRFADRARARAVRRLTGEAAEGRRANARRPFRRNAPNVVMSSTPAGTAQARTNSILSPVIDFLCVGGLSLIVFIPLLASGRSDLVIIGAGAHAWFATLINMPHFMASYRLIYRSREMMLRHKWASIYIPSSSSPTSWWRSGKRSNRRCSWSFSVSVSSAYLAGTTPGRCGA
jgi:hypothetical protein